MPQVWNLPTIGSGLPVVAEALYRRQRDDERQRVLQSEDARRTEELGMRREQFGMQKEQFAQGQQSAAEQKRMKDSLAELQTIKALPPEEQERWAAGLRAKEPRLANVPTPQLLQSVEAGLHSQLGIRETPGQLYKTNEGYLPADRAVGKMPYDEPNQYAPERSQWSIQEDEDGQLWRIDATGRSPPQPVQTPGGRHLGAKRGAGTRPQIIPPAYPGAPTYEVVPGEGGAQMRRVPEMGGQSAQGAPAGLPPGSKQIGTSGGKPVYETPDGRRLIAE